MILWRASWRIRFDWRETGMGKENDEVTGWVIECGLFGGDVGWRSTD
jgi:hypothetical protein